MMHPTGHVSTPKQYSSKPKRISGALYHRVSISCVRALSGTEKTHARPKSAILTNCVLSSMSMFYGLISLWNIQRVWQWYNASNICLVITSISLVSKSPYFVLMYFLKSMGRNSNTKNNFWFKGLYMISSSLIMLGWLSSFNELISLKVVLGIPSSSYSSLIFLMATI